MRTVECAMGKQDGLEVLEIEKEQESSWYLNVRIIQIPQN